jgi:glycosyltransferase involved in cell wall biosynthesis
VSHSKIIILLNTLQRPKASAHSTVITIKQLRAWILKGIIFKHIFRYHTSKLLTYYIDAIPKPFLIATLLRLLSRKKCLIEDDQGRHQNIGIKLLAKLFRQLVKDGFQKTKLLQQIQREVLSISINFNSRNSKRELSLSASPIYLRTDLWLGVRAGGSIAHIAGVLNHLEEFIGKPVLISSDIIPTVRDDLEIHCIFPRTRFRDFNELPFFHFNEIFMENAKTLMSDRKWSFIYQRYSLNNYSGVKLALSYDVPFVLEYNGSEIWINRHWGKPLKYEPLSERIELLNLNAADVVVVVSQAMKDELTARGIEAEKILVNPNGVDTELYSPDIDGYEIRNQYNLDGKTVIGFIGTFGQWHGAEALADAFGRLLTRFPEYREKLRLLMIGDGPAMPEVKKKLSEFGILSTSILTGLVIQEKGPAHMAACDILVSPHVPNPDGTPFFGSPTKLFEYMSMGKGIVASDLYQIGEVLKHNETGWLVKPGDTNSLMMGLKTLIDKPELRERLGKTARQEAIAKYTWKEHTRKIIEKLNNCSVK